MAVTHGHSSNGKLSPTYIVWKGMIDRCQNPHSTSFEHYGAKGITVYSKWQTFAGFLADMGVRPPGLSLDRKDATKDYCLENCQWVPRAEQNREKRKPFSFNGLTLSLPEWAVRLGVSRSTLAQRLYVYGWPIEKVLKEEMKIGG